MLTNVIEKRFPDGTYQLCYSSALSGAGGYRGEDQDSDREPNKEVSRRASVTRAVKTVFDIARSNEWDLMTTFTFDPQKVDSFDYDKVTETMKKYNRRLRRSDITYIEVPELHQSGRIHLHGVVSDPGGNLYLEPAKNFYTGELQLDDAGRPMYDICNFEFGWAKATYVDDQARSGMVVVKYIMKYMNKALDWIPEGKKRYFASQGLQRPVENRLLLSVEDDIIDEISRKADYRRVINAPFGPWVLLEIHPDERSRAGREKPGHRCKSKQNKNIIA